MSWIDRVLHRHPALPPEAVKPADRADLAAWQTKHRALLSKADDAIQRAMAHADEVMGYKGPERRHRPR